MKQIRIEAHGGPEALQFLEAEEPSAGPGHVKVRVRAVGLNHLDLWVRRGVPGHRFPLPLVPGSDCAGEIADGPRAGERVCIAPAFGCGQCPACQRGQENLCRHYEIRGEGGDGGLSEFVVVPERDLLPIPEHLSFEQAAALPLSGVTAWQMLRKAHLQPGETVLILGGTSGVGSLAIQIAAAKGPGFWPPQGPLKSANSASSLVLSWPFPTAMAPPSTDRSRPRQRAPEPTWSWSTSAQRPGSEA